MKLLFPILRKDFLGLRWWLALWLGVLSIPIGFGLAVLLFDPSGASVAVNVGTKICTSLSYVEFALVYLLTLLLMQQDEVMGTRQFWSTRPISWGRLLLGKVAGAFVIFGAMPTILSLPWWIAAGFDAITMVKLAADALAVYVLIALPAALVAVCARTLTEAFFWSLVVAVVAGVVIVIWVGYITIPLQGTELNAPRVVVASVVLMCATGAALVRQFASRNVWSSLCWVGCGLVTAACVAMWWPWRWEEAAELRDRNASLASDIAIEFEQAKIFQSSIPRGIEISLVGTGGETLDRVAGVAATHVWRWRDDTEVDAGNVGNFSRTDWSEQSIRKTLGLGARVPDRETEEWRKQHEAGYARRTAGPVVSNVRFVNSLGFEDSALRERIGRDPPSYETQAWFSLQRPSVVSENPIQVGTCARFGTGAIRIRQLEKTRHGVDVITIKTRAVLRTLGLWNGTFQATWLQIPRGYMVKRTQGELQLPPSMSGWSFQIKGVSFHHTGFAADVAQVVRQGTWTFDFETWLSDASLVFVKFDEEARFHRDIKIDRFLAIE